MLRLKSISYPIPLPFSSDFGSSSTPSLCPTGRSPPRSLYEIPTLPPSPNDKIDSLSMVMDEKEKKKRRISRRFAEEAKGERGVQGKNGSNSKRNNIGPYRHILNSIEEFGEEI
jgi:hypothetical protein